MHSIWYSAHVESAQSSLNTCEVAEVTWQQCSVSFWWQHTNNLTSPLMDLWWQGQGIEWALDLAGSRDAHMSSTKAMPLRSAQIVGHHKKEEEEEKKGGGGVLDQRISCSFSLWMPVVYMFALLKLSISFTNFDCVCLWMVKIYECFQVHLSG